MKTIIFLWISLSVAPLAAAATPAELRRQVAEQERQIRQLEIENARLRYMLTEVEHHQGDPLYGTTVSGGSSGLAMPGRVSAPDTAPPPDQAHKPTGVARPAKEPDRGVAGRETTQKPQFHAIRAGENLYRISLRYGVDLDSLFAANPGIDARRLRVGQQVRIPRSEPMLAHRD